MNAVVFAGPTLSAEAAAAALPGAVVLPPARQGDIWRAVRAHRPVAVGLIDGVFLHEPAVWHREILWALNEGVHVFGAASMGALRAAELAAFGMRGIGRVFEAYRDGAWPGFSDAFEDDDEVAVIHTPAELGARPLSDAMVDLRDTLLATEAAGLLGPAERDALCAALKALPFPERHVRALADLAAVQLPADQAERLRAWLPAGRVARKRLDAEAMLAALAAFLADAPAPFVPDFRFERVQVWADFLRAEAAMPEADEALVLEELRLHPAKWREVAVIALSRMQAAAQAAPDEAALRRAGDALRLERELARRTDVDAWRTENALSDTAFERLLRGEAALAEAVAASPPGLAVAMADALRLAGDFVPLLRRAQAKRAALGALPVPADGPDLDAALGWFAGRHNITLSVLRNDSALAGAVWREYVFQRRNR